MKIIVAASISVVCFSSSFVFSMSIVNSMTKTNQKDSSYMIRPYNSQRDEICLADICKNVFNGTDYLPSVASSFEADPSCDFVVMEINNTRNETAAGDHAEKSPAQQKQQHLVAVGNRRMFDYDGTTAKTSIAWLEAIRTSESHMGRGLATKLILEMIHKSKQEGLREVLTCTVETNAAMKRIFQKVGMTMIHKVHWLDFDTLRTLPGWASSPSSSISKEVGFSNDMNDSKGEPSPMIAKNVLQAFDLEHLISERAKAEKWEIVQNKTDLEAVLKKIKNNGGIGHMPGLGKLLWSGGKEIEESLSRGLVRKLDRKDGASAVLLLMQDPAIVSLKSSFVCSIAATTQHDFQSALWEACSDEIITLSGPAFALAFDGSIDEGLDSDSDSGAGKLLSSLPVRRDNPFVVYSCQL